MESHPLVYIRTDGNETIATGHLMRCLSIARALKKRGAAVAFLVSDDTSASILQKSVICSEENLFQSKVNAVVRHSPCGEGLWI